MDNKTVYDLIVVGTGTAGSTVASNCRSNGLKVAIIDSLPFGGTCALRGCEPKKILIEAAKTIDANHRHGNKGISDIDKVHVCWRNLINFKRTFTEPFPKQREDSYIKAGIVPIHGKAKFIDMDTIKVEYNKNADETNIDIIKGKYILVATGARPINLGIPGTENVITSDQFLDLWSYQLPDNIVFIGGGYISFEFAHIAARSGVKKITIFHRGKQSLEHFDPDLVDQLVQKSKNIGIEVQLETKVERIDKLTSPYSSDGAGNLVVHYSSVANSLTDDNSTKTLKADMVVHGAGRVPNLEDLDLKAGGIEQTSRGIKVNEYLQSVSNPIVYAAGDVASSGGAPLTPVASYDGNIVSTNILNGNSIKSNYVGLPSVVFTIPPLALVGLKEKDAIEQGLQFRTNHNDTSGWYSTRRVGETHSGFKILIEQGSDRILGAHLLGPHAEEVINIFSMAIRLGLTVKDLNDPILYAYPTNTSDVIYML
ncbi:MAG: NAD(P)/FAD-dependent oxidoreductase [Candidatus Nitrosocosmicus sp.]|nr:NAD(P)/FAD-dependent oxidoreductase [Candidatus Nitrosocosmicus sp.]MDN5867297.1 NAD(P)/FAD-dependent oxidoreductase [Candidatus Nitrosocosmicus sp.]